MGWRWRHQFRFGRALAVLLVAAVLAGCTHNAGPPAASRTAQSSLGQGPSLGPGYTPPSAVDTATPYDGPLQSVDWSLAVLPLLNCFPTVRGLVPASIDQVAYVQPDQAHELAIILARCSIGTGGAPEGLYAFDQAMSHTSAHLLQTLVPTQLERLMSGFSTSQQPSSGPSSPVGTTIIAQEAAYTQDAALCCPTLNYTVTWTWSGSSYVGSPADAATTKWLVVTVTASTPEVRLGDEVTYTLAITDIGPSDVTNLELVPVATKIPCPLAATVCPDTPALVWVGGSPACSYRPSSQSASCPLATLHPQASVTLHVVMKVAAALNPIVFQPDISGTTSRGRMLPFEPEVTITVAS